MSAKLKIKALSDCSYVTIFAGSYPEKAMEHVIANAKKLQLCIAERYIPDNEIEIGDIVSAKISPKLNVSGRLTLKILSKGKTFEEKGFRYTAYQAEHAE